MQIAIFETNHYEVTYPVIRLFDNNINKITIFIYEPAYRQLTFIFNQDLHRYNWVVKGNRESKYAFMIRMYAIIKRNNTKLLYLNTIPDNYLLYYALVKLVAIRTVLTLHSVNGYFFTRRGFGIRHNLNFLGRRLLVKKIREFNVISHTMVPYLKNKLPAGKKVYCIPGAIYEPQVQAGSMPELTNGIHLVIPGTIDVRRRHYDLVFDLLEAARHLSLPVTITLLGGHYGAYGKQILERCKSWIQHNQTLAFYETDTVDQPEFNRVMQRAHLVWVPCVTRPVVFDGHKETYGISKSSGNIYDVVKFAKPFIAPAALRFDEYLEKSCIRYSEVQDIITFLQTIILQPQLFYHLHQQSRQASMHYTINAVRRRNTGIL